MINFLPDSQVKTIQTVEKLKYCIILLIMWFVVFSFLTEFKLLKCFIYTYNIVANICYFGITEHST